MFPGNADGPGGPVLPAGRKKTVSHGFEIWAGTTYLMDQSRQWLQARHSHHLRHSRLMDRKDRYFLLDVDGRSATPLRWLMRDDLSEAPDGPVLPTGRACDVSRTPELRFVY
jgi:hypothetical protein